MRSTDRTSGRSAAAAGPRLPAWRRNQIAVTVAAALVFLGFTLVMPFLPFFVQSLGVRGTAAVAAWSGLLLTISPLLAALLGPFWGRLADRVGMRLMVQRVLLTITLQWGLMFFVTSVWQVLGLRILLGLFSGFGTMSVALVTHGCPRARIGEAVGTLQATQTLSTALGPVLGGALAHAIGIRATFLVTFALCAIALALVALLYRDTAEDEGSAPPAAAGPVVVGDAGPVASGVRAVLPERPAKAPRPGGGRSLREVIGLPLLAALLPILFFVTAVDRSLGLSVPLAVADFIEDERSAVAATGAIVSLGSLAGAASAYLLGRAAARVPPLTILAWSLFAGAAAILPLPFCRSAIAFGTLRTLLGLAVGGAATLAYTIGGEVIPPGVRAYAYGILSSTAMLGGSMGPVLSGLLASIDLRAPFLAGGLLYLALTAHVALLRRRAATAAPGGGR